MKLKLLMLALVCLCVAPNARALTWYWSNPQPHGNDVAAMVSFNGLTIQATDLGQLYTSPDLQTWTPRVTGTTNDLQSAVVFGNQLIVTGANGTVLSSPDGVNYNYTNLATTNWLVAVTASPNLAVAVGDNAAIYTTPNGSAWAKQSKPPGVGTDWLQGVAYGDGIYIAVGDDGYVATSSNGVSWTKRAAVATGDLTYVGYVNTPGGSNTFALPSFIAVSDSGEVIVSTNNGVSWTAAPDYTTTTNTLYTAAADNDSRLIAGSEQFDLERLVTGKAAWFSQIGSELLGEAPSWNYFCSLWDTNSGAQYLVSGEAGLTMGSFETNSLYSWFQFDDSNRSWLWEMTTNAGLYIAVGLNASIMTSDDGVNWVTEAVPLTNGISVTNTVLFGVGGSSNQLIAVGNAGATLLSTNLFVAVVTTNAGVVTTNSVSTIGVVWNPIPPPTTNDLQGVALFGGEYYISGGNGTILQSPNGTTWTKIKAATSDYLSGLAVGSNTFVAVGDKGTILSSTTGTNWTARASGTTNWIFRVRYLGGTLIAVGENGTILTSSNGTAWTKRASGTTSWLNDVTMVTNTFYVVGDSGTILSSTNAVNWTIVPTITGSSLFGAATQNGQLVVAGDSGVILQSQVVPIPTQLQFLDFVYTNNAALFLVAATNLAVDLQFTLDSSTDLLDWTTGPLIDMISGPLLFYETEPTNSPFQTFRATLVQ